MNKLKKIMSVIPILVFVAILFMGAVVSRSSRETKRYGYIDSWTFTLTGADTDTSSTVELPYPFASTTTHPYRYEYYMTTNSDTVNLTMKAYGSFDGTNWNEIETIWSLADSSVTSKRLSGTFDLNNEKWPLVQYRIAEAAGQNADTTFTVVFKTYVPKM